MNASTPIEGLDYMVKEIQRFLKTSTLADTTKELYRHYLEMLAEWMETQALPPVELDAEEFIDFLGEHPAWSDSTQHSAACAAKSFYRWRYGPGQPIEAVKVKRRDPGPQRTLETDQVNQLLASLNTTTREGIRNLAIVTLALDTGLRNAEICRLEVDYLDLRRCHLDVVIKGGKWDEAVFSDYTASCLGTWLTGREYIALPKVQTVFVGIKGRTPGRPLTPPGLRCIFRAMGFRSEIGLISPHDMRRTMATIATEIGAPSRTVQKAGRWSNIDMVERYTKRLKQKAFRKYFPVSYVMGAKEEN
jgi:integrase/recombinase XerD